MDGLPLFFPQQFSSDAQPVAQQTLKAAIGCVGVGLHSGRRIRLTLRPSPAGHGIVFRRTDLGIDIPARYDHVVDTDLCTAIGLPEDPEIRIGTVEHVMAAIAASGLTNVTIEVDGPEIPVLDGSAASFLFLIDCAGLEAQAATAPVIEIVRSVRVSHGAAFAELHPGFGDMQIAMSIDFPVAAIGRQNYALSITPDSFRTELARARTFTLAHEVAALQSRGLALGGSLDNAIVVDGAEILNPGGLRMPGEFVRHKILDAVGDLALAGASLRGRLVSHRGGHAMNNQLLRALFADDANWRMVPGQPIRETRPMDGAAAMSGLGSWQERRLAVAAAPA